MGIPDTHTMTIHHYTQTHTAIAEESSCNQTQEPTPSWFRVFRRALPIRKREKIQQGVSEFNSSVNTSYEDCEDNVKATNTYIFTPAEIKEATCNYRSENIIGEGSSGTVFKGILPSNQRIAVKREAKSTRCMKAFVNEIRLLSQINNRNVVKLLGCCFETNIPSIVYEYIPNGSLSDHLFDEEKARLLTWNRRLMIAVQVAQVLDYLHNTIRLPIIHRDIKPSNILLDDNYVAMVSDFGISKLVSEQYVFDAVTENTWEREIGSLYTCVVGTFGYMAPEYMPTGRLTHKTDVYSFGVVLAQLLTRTKAFWNKSEDGYTFLANTFCENESEDEGRFLANTFCKKLKEDRLVEILDKQLINAESMDQLKKVADLAARCLEKDPKARPSARQVVRLLEDIRGF